MTSPGSEMKPSKNPTVFPILAFSPRKGSKTWKPPSNSSAKSRWTWVARWWSPRKADLFRIDNQTMANRKPLAHGNLDNVYRAALTYEVYRVLLR